MWQFVFILIAVSGGLYFVVARRAFDLPALAYFSACFYFLPGFVGFAGHAQGLEVVATPLEPGTYWVFCSVLSAIFVTALVGDRSSRLPPIGISPGAASCRLAATVGVILGTAGMVVTILVAGNELLQSEKAAVMGALNRWHLLWTCSATIAFALAVVARSIGLRVIALGLLLLNLYIGFRVDLVVAIVTAATIWLLRQGPTRLMSHWALGVGLAVVALCMFGIKYLLVALQLGDAGLIESQIRDPAALRYVFLHSEPFIAQGTLNEIVHQGFWVGPQHLADVFYLLVPFASGLGAEAQGFNALFQPVLFSTVTDYGLGNNIWAEMLASGGWLLFALFLLLYCVSLRAGDALLRRLPANLFAPAMVILTYWGFYIHRNDLLYELTLMRRVAMVALLIFAVAILFRLAATGITSAADWNTKK